MKIYQKCRTPRCNRRVQWGDGLLVKLAIDRLVCESGVASPQPYYDSGGEEYRRPLVKQDGRISEEPPVSTWRGVNGIFPGDLLNKALNSK